MTGFFMRGLLVKRRLGRTRAQGDALSASRRFIVPVDALLVAGS